MKKLRRVPRVQLHPALSLLAAILLSGAIALLCLWIQPNSLRAVLRVFRAQPMLIFLNCLPIGLLVLIFACLFRNVFSSAALVAFSCGILSAANRIKLEVRDEPVFPRDLALLKEVGSATSSYDIRWPWSILAVIVAFTLILAILSHFIGCKPFSLVKKKDWLLRLTGLLVSAAALITLIFTLYASNNLYNSFTVSNPYYVPAVFNELGFPYCFTHHFTTYTVEKPDGFQRQEAEAWDQEEVSTSEGKQVHVVFVMNEAFSDLTDNDVFTYGEEDDPLANFHAIEADDHAISGHLVVPGFAGGTANTEFDVLTGMQTNALSATTTSAFRAVNRNLDSLFRLYSDDGYRTLFLHPGYDWFYNRENVYRWLGAKESLFIEDLPDAEYKGTWVTDAYLTDQIEQQFADTVAAGETLFNYTVTIQNHMSYTADKYGTDYVFPPAQVSVPLSDAAETLLSVYVEGVRDADAMLGDLTAYFSASEEPVVLVFYGDHLPYLGDNQLVYSELGLEVVAREEERQRTFCSYETPYVLWANDAAAQALDWETTVANLDLPEDRSLSACYLGAAVLELTGRNDESAWFRYLNQVRRELPVIQKKLYETADGTLVKQGSLSAEQQALVSRLRQWSYYKLKYKEVN